MVFLSIFFIIFSSFNFMFGNQNINYILTIQFPCLENVPVAQSYYKGEKLEFERDFCRIPEDTRYANFTLVITPDIEHKADGNNIKYLERIPNLDCKIFYLHQYLKNDDLDVSSEGAIDQDYEDIKWTITPENDIKSLSLKINDNAIVLLMNPKYVSEVISSDSKNILISKNNIDIKLPLIILSCDKAEEKEFARSFDYAAIAALNLKPIHGRAKKDIVNNSCSIVSIRKK